MNKFKTKEKKVIAIHQPNYIPWVGYFYKIYQSNVFVFLDDIQYSNKGMHNYHYIKTPQGSFRLKFPVEQHLGDSINCVRSKDESGWKEKHIKTLENFYRKALHFDEVIEDFKQIILQNYSNIALMNAAVIKSISGKLGIKTRFIFSSDLTVSNVKEEKILNICEALRATIYYSGTGAQVYQNEEDFITNDIELRYSQFKPFEYPQFWNGFQSNVSIIDYLMHCGYDWTRVLVKQEKD